MWKGNLHKVCRYSVREISTHVHDCYVSEVPSQTPSLPDFKSGMPAFGEQLSHEEIVAVLTYVKSLWGGKTSRGSSIAEWQAMGSVEDPFPPAP